MELPEQGLTRLKLSGNSLGVLMENCKCRSYRVEECNPCTWRNHSGNNYMDSKYLVRSDFPFMGRSGVNAVMEAVYVIGRKIPTSLTAVESWMIES